MQGNRSDRLGHQGRGWQDKRPGGLHAEAEYAVRMKRRMRSGRAVMADSFGKRLRVMRMNGGARPVASHPVVLAGHNRDREEQREQRLHANPGQSEPDGEYRTDRGGARLHDSPYLVPDLACVTLPHHSPVFSLLPIIFWVVSRFKKPRPLEHMRGDNP